MAAASWRCATIRISSPSRASAPSSATRTAAENYVRRTLLVAGGVRLEPLEESHLEAVAAMNDDPDVLRYTRVPDPVPAGWMQEWFEFYEQGRRDGTRGGF